ncbi:MAG TPA: helix-turn-helix transcriptional regulator [Sphingobium sp.]|uniref:helix-turn-helix domain-containing protein n=1 Tax=Sphingobium sp. TaxID=1912891 RepID=UPI002ED5F8EC
MAKREIPSTKRILARNLRQLRLARGFSQDDLAAEAGLRQALISAIEVGTANPTLDSLDRVASALKIDLSILLDRAAR